MTYQQTIDYLYASQPAFHLVGAKAYKPGLENTLRLMQHLGNPHEQLRAVHIAGTNGKGSTSHLIAAVLQAQGYKVGLFTSPHLVDFRERIRVSGEMIPQEMVVRFVEDNRAFLDELQPSFFETTMALAFSYFVQQQVDVAVVEVGLGGRLDSTNILSPILSVITNIGIDHTEFLGSTLADIAEEKAGIIKPNVACVIGETHPETQDVFVAHARANSILGDGLETTNCRLWFADQCGYMRKRRLKEAPLCQLTGIYQDKNQQTAFVALQVLRNYCNMDLSSEAIAKGFAEVCTLTGLRGRWERLASTPLTICDTGHNGHGMKYVAEQLNELIISHRQTHPKAILHIVLGMVNDKDVDTVLSYLPADAKYYFAQSSTPRALPAEELQSRWLKLHPNYQLSCSNATHDYSTPNNIRTVNYQLSLAQNAASNEDIIFIGGSNYVVGEVLGTKFIK